MSGKTRGGIRGKLRQVWKRLLANFRLSESAVCDASADGTHDFHTLADCGNTVPCSRHTCRRCGKTYFG